MAKNIEVVQSFVSGDNWVTKAGNLKIEKNKLINYNTVIAEKTCDNHMIVNLTKYSSTTTAIQNKLVDILQFQFDGYYDFVTNIPEGTGSLQ